MQLMMNGSDRTTDEVTLGMTNLVPQAQANAQRKAVDPNAYTHTNEP